MQKSQHDCHDLTVENAMQNHRILVKLELELLLVAIIWCLLITGLISCQETLTPCRNIIYVNSYLLSENRFRLTTKTLLFTVITSSTLGELWLLWFLVLCHFKLLMIITHWVGTIRPPSFGNINLQSNMIWFTHVRYTASYITVKSILRIKDWKLMIRC